MKKFFKSLIPDIRDIFCFTGIGLLSTGLWMIYVPSALIVAGIIFGYLGVRRW
jgi:hypothetical protein